MTKVIVLTTVLGLSALGMACGETPANNANTNKPAANTMAPANTATPAPVNTATPAANSMAPANNSAMKPANTTAPANNSAMKPANTMKPVASPEATKK